MMNFQSDDGGGGDDEGTLVYRSDNVSENRNCLDLQRFHNTNISDVTF